MTKKSGSLNNPANIVVLGGGVAGLSVAYYAKINGLSFKVYEALNRIGGNCITIKHGDFLFDSGAHRFHDKNEEATKIVRALVGEDLVETSVPSQIYHGGKFLNFPLTPLNLMKNLSILTFTRAAADVLYSKLKREKLIRSFQSFALKLYGRTIAEKFLLNYSEKLWGIACDKLSPAIAGERLKGLDLLNFLKGKVFANRAKVEHFEGSFYYPKAGIGTIAEKLAELCGHENIRTDAKITRILHDYKRIRAVEINGKEIIDTNEVVSTLPITNFVHIMEPNPKEEVLKAAKRLRYRNVILVSFFINRETITEAATIYFPDRQFPFTRIYEPKKRSAYMSPPGKTSLVVEIPCWLDDNLWSAEDNKLIQIIFPYLSQIWMIKREECIDMSVKRLCCSYPVLEMGFEGKVEILYNYLNAFVNLELSGRSGRFVYAWIHDMLRFGKEIVDSMR
jgi:protoporphyrinogen oxidase